ncbi:uncharacterized protein LOC121730100 isoform X2 [Aricia agestis]|uniref:uncharacterized protein LOC121730100 isoform X2 n=1 Tax=Aricia agestis TaxID=91739 RepID=UPI001C20A5F1|nr:uncharacterized protein LOC121730100 isoform X2 [Aricia agestis]
MKRSSLCGQHNIISQVHIADGFYDDCDELVSRCTKLQTLDFQSFCSIWKEMNFGYIYQGRSSGPEIAELSEELIHIVKYYLVRNTSNFEESVAGLFIAYGLLSLQPYADFAWMRIIPDDVPALRRIELVARREKRQDVLFILGDVLINHCQYHASERERGLEKSYRKHIEGCTGIDKLGVRPKGVFYRQNEELDVIRELGTLTRQYVRAKNFVVGSVSSPSLNYIDEGMSDELDTSLKKIINGMTEDMKDSDDDDELEHYDAVQAIKRRAMGKIVDPIKHLTSVQDRKVKKASTSRSDLKSPKGKIKGGSPKKPIPGSTAARVELTELMGKRKRPISPSPPSKRRIAERTLCEAIANLDTDSDTELNMQEFSRVGTDNSPVKKNNTSPVPDTEEVDIQTVHDLDIELNSLPIIITTGEPGESIEIEIFDEYMGNNEETNASTANPSTSDNTDTSPSGNRKIIKKKAALSQKLKPTETRNLKRHALKSKFKKMGILPAANFEENTNE